MSRSILFFGLFFISCVSQKKNNDPAKQVQRWFPEDVELFFSQSLDWTKNHLSRESASAGVQMIACRRLTQTSEPFHETNLNWSTNGRYLGYERTYDGMRTVSLKDLSGTFHKQVAVHKNQNKPLNDYYGFKTWNSGLRWSSKKPHYVFVSNGGSGQFDIYHGSISGGEMAVTQDHAKDGHASWSPVSDEIIYVSAKTGHGDIYLTDFSSDATIRITGTDGPDLFPEWSPEGQRVFYSSGEINRHQLMVVERDRDVWKKPRAVTDWQADILRPTISPDGSLLAFYASSGDNWNLHVLPWVPGKVWREYERQHSVVAVDAIVDLNTGPTWSPNGHKIFYVAKTGLGKDSIFVWDFITSKRYVLKTKTHENRDLRISKFGVLSFRAQEGAWDRVYLALTNQGDQIQKRHQTPKKRFFNWSFYEVFRF